MFGRNYFKKPKNELEFHGKLSYQSYPVVPDSMWVKCPSCSTMLLSSDLSEHFHVCPKCSHHFRMSARQRIAMTFDNGSVKEMFTDIGTKDVLSFPDYDIKLKNAKLESFEDEAVICLTGKIGGYKCASFVMEPYFMMGSMGTAVGERITRLFEYADENRLPVIAFTVSGGARMQEGILSLMQMAKTSGAVKRHNESGLLYIAVLTDPTTGGVTASFAMEGDITLAEPGALIGFAGPRVIEQTTRQKLPKDFQRAQFVLEKGFIDDIVARCNQREYLSRLLYLHGGIKE